jgi:hypothetical protein
VLLDERSLGRGLFQRAALQTLLEHHFSGATERVEVVFRLLLLELWQQATIDAPPHIPDPLPAPVTVENPA